MPSIQTRTPLNRRMLLRTAAGTGWVALSARFAFAADFWNKKESSQWTPQEIETLKTKSPWAKKVHGEMAGGRGGGGGRGSGIGGSSMDASGSRGTFGGMSGAESNGISTGGGGRGGGGSRGGGGGEGGGGGGQVQEGPEVIVRWENAEPVLAATKFQLPANLQNHYAISITGLPPQLLAMVINGRGGGSRRGGREGDQAGAPAPAEAPAATPPTPEQQAELVKAREQRLLHAVSLAAKGKDPQNADTVMQTSDKQTLIFGFAKDALPLGPGDKDVEFVMHAGPMTIKAKFEPKEMNYKGTFSA
jgi:hypothetical protein